MSDATMLREQWLAKIKTLNERVWERRADRPAIDAWLSNFADDWPADPSEQLHALFLLSHFMYFGDVEIRVLLTALYRDLFKYPIIEGLRQADAETLNGTELQARFRTELSRTRFLGIGNPAESGTHLLYYFRQENELTKELFIHTHQIFSGRLDAPEVGLADSSLTRYVLIDDFCGSGDQAKEYSEKVIATIRAAAARADVGVEICYYVLFASAHGLARIRSDADFDRVSAVYELDSSYRTFGDDSRYFLTHPDPINRDFAHQMCRAYGDQLWPACPLGYRDGQLMIGFHHNTPDNTLPILWFDRANPPWVPMFRRYHKK
jgi:hypothetical protein